jgi:hypothetical protein
MTCAKSLFLEAGVGIEPAYTALQAAALFIKSIRCGLTPAHRAVHAVVACRLFGGRNLASSLDLACGRDGDFSRAGVS